MNNQIFFHSNTLPRVTVCGIINKNDNTLSIGVARCSKNTAYVKKLGRKISQGRAAVKPIATIQLSDEQPISGQFVPIATELANNVSANSKLVHPVVQLGEGV